MTNARISREQGSRHAGLGASRPRWAAGAAIAAAIFGAATIFAASATLFGPQQVKEAAGAIVYFVLWFNFFAGFAYLVAAYGLYRWRPWVMRAASAIALATALVALAFAVDIAFGGAFSWRTPGALVLRVGFWAAIAGALWRVSPRGIVRDA